MSDAIYTRMFDALVRRIGGVDAAAAVIEARTGSMTKSTVSKMARGQMCVTLEAVDALEDALGSHPVTRMRFERIGEASGHSEPLAGLIASACRESGEAMAALVGRDLSERERSEALAEVAEAMDAFAALKSRLEADQ